MNFYSKKLKEIRTEKSIPIIFLAEQIGVSRRTVWLWESGKGTPKEKYIREIADILNIDVREISDLNPGTKRETKKFDDVIGSWVDMASNEDIERITDYKNFIKGISKLFKNLEQTNIILKAILSIKGTKFYIKDADNNFILGNNEFKELVNIDTNSNIFGSNDYRFFSKEEAKINSEEDGEVIFNGKTLNREGYIPGSRKKRWGIITKQPVIGKNKKCFGMVGTFFDITERRNSEEIRELLELNLNAMDNAVLIIDKLTKKYLYINPAISKLYGYSLDEIYSKDSYFWINKIVHPDHRVRESDYLDNYSWPKDREYKIICKDGSEKWINSFISDVKSYKGHEYSIIIEKNITEYKHKIEEIEILNTVLNKLDSAVWIGKTEDNQLKSFEVTYSNKNFNEKFLHSITVRERKKFFNFDSVFCRSSVIPEKNKDTASSETKVELQETSTKRAYCCRLIKYKENMYIGILDNFRN